MVLSSEVCGQSKSLKSYLHKITSMGFQREDITICWIDVVKTSQESTTALRIWSANLRMQGLNWKILMFIVKIFWNLIGWWGESVKALLLSAILSGTTFISVGLIRTITVPASTAEECVAESVPPHYVAPCISENNILERRVLWFRNIWTHRYLFVCLCKDKQWKELYFVLHHVTLCVTIRWSL
jgi:hypothetical protein